MATTGSDTAAAYKGVWYNLFMVWQIIHWVLLVFVTGGSAAVASSLVASSTLKDVLALAVAVVGAIYTALNPGQRAEAHREAWVILNTAILSDSNVVAAYAQGEQIIGRRPTPSQ